MTKILLIEDNSEISNNIKEYLQLENFSVTQAFDGEQGIERALREEYDIILLDLMLPIVDGVSLARKVRQKKDTPIIMTTARESLEHRLEGFEVGAVDYLVKPFDLKELVARIRVHLRSPKSYNTQEVEKLQIWDIVFDIHKQSFFRGSQEIHLTQKEFLIFQKLYEERRRVVSRSEIIESLWGEESLFDGGDNKLDVYISNLRAKLGKQSIKTVKSVWYILWELS
jgi:two-component system, OmpR family, response regulator ArlR